MDGQSRRAAPGRAVLVTGNPGKLVEARRLFPRLEAQALELPEIQSLDVDEVAAHKAREAWQRLRRPVIVDETSLEISSLAGFPGPLVKWMLTSVGAEGMARIAAREGGTGAMAVCVLRYQDGGRDVSVRGSVAGDLVLPARGEHGFGWDSVFRPSASERTYAEMEPEEKDRVSHRGRAWSALFEALAESGIVI